MRAYVTKNNEYPVTIINERETIPSFEGENKGKLYGIIGFLSGKIPEGNDTFHGEVQFISNEPTKDLSKYLDSTPREGKRILAKLLDDKGKFVDERIPGSVMITSPIQEIKE